MRSTEAKCHVSYFDKRERVEGEEVEEVEANLTLLLEKQLKRNKMIIDFFTTLSLLNNYESYPLKRTSYGWIKYGFVLVNIYHIIKFSILSSVFNNYCEYPNLINYLGGDYMYSMGQIKRGLYLNLLLYPVLLLSFRILFTIVPLFNGGKEAFKENCVYMNEFLLSDYQDLNEETTSTIRQLGHLTQHYRRRSEKILADQTILDNHNHYSILNISRILPAHLNTGSWLKRSRLFCKSIFILIAFFSTFFYLIIPIFYGIQWLLSKYYPLIIDQIHLIESELYEHQHKCKYEINGYTYLMLAFDLQFIATDMTLNMAWALSEGILILHDQVTWSNRLTQDVGALFIEARSNHHNRFLSSSSSSLTTSRDGLLRDDNMMQQQQRQKQQKQSTFINVSPSDSHTSSKEPSVVGHDKEEEKHNKDRDRDRETDMEEIEKRSAQVQIDFLMLMKYIKRIDRLAKIFNGFGVILLITACLMSWRLFNLPGLFIKLTAFIPLILGFGYMTVECTFFSYINKQALKFYPLLSSLLVYDDPLSRRHTNWFHLYTFWYGKPIKCSYTVAGLFNISWFTYAQTLTWLFSIILLIGQSLSFGKW